MADPKDFDDQEGTGKIVRIVKRETSDQLGAIEKTAKRWHILLGVAVALLGGLVGVVKWFDGIGRASAIEANTRRIDVLDDAMRQLVEQSKEERHARDIDRAAHDAELRWVADHMSDFKVELDDVARAAGVPVKRHGR